ncbi:MAG: HAD family hydrolase [Bacteroidetes bacterium]|uniref:HAD family hydrolase n=1 Tax=Candidatus Cryptobacteroides intestinigallinarum TaxID=2840767 RepID=A0A9D9HKH5_9BACT|nr:HAD family hydrolase [Candidatus Cryptobacteroides intestinigallinarum]
MIPEGCRYVFFDADDTLWENESYFREAEHRFALLLSDYAPEKDIVDMLMQKQEENIPVYGYGSKTYLIGMLDAATELCGEDFSSRIYLKTKQIIHDLAYHEFHLIDGIEDILKALRRKYRLAVATKGDLPEQMNKYRESGLQKYFHHIEVMEKKSEEDYLAMAAKLDIRPQDMVMVGNSVKSDIAPVINIGGVAIHVPHEVTWAHEMMDIPDSERVIEVKNIREIVKILL